MSTTISISRKSGFHKSDALREDTLLREEALRFSAWLAERELETVTMNQVLGFAREADASAALARAGVEYEWVWVPEEQKWILVCRDEGRITYRVDEDGDEDLVEIRVAISARY
ncbi:MAG: hypothetical protein JNK02_09725 [Planctomycetes bacterium]|nr:hypothetical protein [Planctomycetota bacterium]